MNFFIKKFFLCILSSAFISFALYADEPKNQLLAEIPAKVNGQKDPKDYFNVPFGVALKNNVIYVTDLGNTRIVKLDQNTLQYLGEIVILDKNGKFKQFLLGRPSFDKDGNLWVSDMENGRILKIDESTGKILYQFGSYGDNPGEFHASNGLAFDNNGTLWVADELNSRIQKCDVKKGKCQAFSTGDSSFPQDLAIDGNSLYVCLTWYNKIVKYDIKTMAVLQTFGPSTPFENPTSKKSLSTPRGVSIDSNGSVLVSDNINNRIVIFNSDGSLQREIKNSFIGGPTGIQVSKETGQIFNAQSLYHFFHKYDPQGTFLGTAGKSRNLPFQLNFPNGTRLIGQEIVIADSFNQRVQVFDKKGIYKKTITGFNYPNDIAYDQSGKIYVSDLDSTFLNGRIRVYDQNWNPLNITITFPYFYPYKMAVDSHGNIFVTDKIMDIIYKISGENYQILATYSTPLSTYDQKTGIAIHPKTDQVYVVDSGTSQVLKFDNQLKLLATISRMGHNDGDLFFPGDIGFQENGAQMIIADSGNFRVQFFDPEGNWKETTGNLGSSSNNFFGLIVSRNMGSDFYLLNSAYLNFVRIYNYDIKQKKNSKKKHKLALKKDILNAKILADKKEQREIQILIKTSKIENIEKAKESVIKHFLK